MIISQCAGATDCRGESRVVEEYFDCRSDEPDWNPRYNIAPTQNVPVVRQDPKESIRELSLVRWGSFHHGRKTHPSPPG